MIRASRVAAAGAWSGDPADRVVLDHDRRHRRRLAMTGVRGTAFLLDLPEALALRDGDGLVLEDGRIVAVAAADEHLAEIAAGDGETLARIVWHLGNRHLPVAFGGDRLLIRRDHVIEAMVEGLGGTVRHVVAPFQPEGGAYDGHHHHHQGGQAHPHDHS